MRHSFPSNGLPIFPSPPGKSFRSQHIPCPVSEPAVIFAGYPQRLAEAYPEKRWKEIATLGRILPGWISAEDWKNSAELQEAEVMLATWGLPTLTPEFLAAAPKLKAVFYAAGSVKGFATKEAYDLGIVISSGWLANAIPVAEYAAAAITLSLKRFWAYTQRTQNRDWARNLPVPGAYGSTVGLVSLGATGRRTAEMISNLEVDVIAYDPFAAGNGIRMVSLEKLFRTADVISIHAPLLPETIGMIDRTLMESMKSGATLINTARGAIVVEKDLIEVMTARPDLTALLDVVQGEPLEASSPLFDVPNIVLTPHISGSMGGEVGRLGAWMVEELRAYRTGQPLQHQVTQEKLAQIA